MTKRRRILETIVARLAVITVENGFATDAGATLFLHEAPLLGEDDPSAAIAIIVAPDEGRWTGENVLVLLPVEIQVLTRADLAEPWATVEAAIGDVKAAIELEDRRMGKLLVQHGFTRGSTRTLARQEGSNTVGLGISYALEFIEGWGTP